MAALKTTLTATRMFTDADPYHYTIDNLPLATLDTRDNQVADEVDRRTFSVDVTGGSPALVNATVNFLPTGWTLSLRNGVGDYTITHTVGTANLVVTGQLLGTAGVVYTQAITSTTIQVKTLTMANAAVDCRFQLHVMGR